MSIHRRWLLCISFIKILQRATNCWKDDNCMHSWTKTHLINKFIVSGVFIAKYYITNRYIGIDRMWYALRSAAWTDREKSFNTISNWIWFWFYMSLNRLNYIQCMLECHSCSRWSPLFSINHFRSNRRTADQKCLSL